jgi:hypothetical protein
MPTFTKIARAQRYYVGMFNCSTRNFSKIGKKEKKKMQISIKGQMKI